MAGEGGVSATTDPLAEGDRLAKSGDSAGALLADNRPDAAYGHVREALK